MHLSRSMGSWLSGDRFRWSRDQVPGIIDEPAKEARRNRGEAKAGPPIAAGRKDDAPGREGQQKPEMMRVGGDDARDSQAGQVRGAVTMLERSSDDFGAEDRKE